MSSKKKTAKNKSDALSFQTTADSNKQPKDKIYQEDNSPSLEPAVIFFFTLLTITILLLLSSPLIVFFIIVWLAACSVWAIWKIPEIQVRRLKVENSGGDSFDFERERDILKITDDLRKTMAQIIGGVFFVSSLGMAYYTYLATKERNFYERFMEDVKLLKKDNDASIRINGLYDLENIARDSRDLHPAIMKSLINYIKERSAEIREPKTCNIQEGKTNSDIIFAVQIILGRNTEYDKRDFSIDFSNAMLNNAKTEFIKQNFSKVSSWKNSCLVGTNFTEAIFSDSVDVGNPEPLKTDYENAQFSGAVLIKTRLYGADLSKALSLTEEQIKSGPYIDEKTKFYDSNSKINDGLQTAKIIRIRKIIEERAAEADQKNILGK